MPSLIKYFISKSKSVTDRLAYLNFVHGSLAGSLSAKFNAARGPIKALRDAETAITPRRNIRAGMQLQISRLEHDQQKGMERKIAEIKDQLRRAELEDQGQEREIEILKRKAVRESEQQKWEALREVIIFGYFKSISTYHFTTSMARNLFCCHKQLSPSLLLYQVCLQLWTIHTPVLRLLERHVPRSSVH